MRGSWSIQSTWGKSSRFMFEAIGFRGSIRGRRVPLPRAISLRLPLNFAVPECRKCEALHLIRVRRQILRPYSQILVFPGFSCLRAGVCGAQSACFKDLAPMGARDVGRLMDITRGDDYHIYRAD
jgi:hypothetical protein